MKSVDCYVLACQGFSIHYIVNIMTTKSNYSTRALELGGKAFTEGGQTREGLARNLAEVVFPFILFRLFYKAST